MKAGTYYIGDLCYVMHDVWDEICSECPFAGEYTLKDGRVISIYSTFHGDGEYDGIWVDSCTIGCVRLDEIKDKKPSVNVKKPKEEPLGWKKVTFREDFTTGEFHGKLRFGDVVIDTL